MTMTSIGVITNGGATKVAAAWDSGGWIDAVSPVIGIGSGGHHATTGAVLTPGRSLTAVPGQFMTKTCASFTRVGKEFEIKLVLNSSDTAATGRVVSSIGLYDNVSTLLAVINFSPRPKDEYNTITLEWKIEF